ncbi:hypothetical protein [uncultured Tateyamaria sp.]|uniref:hypothetical protein n=2 Tax=uncultured Tateyamaria sp. TaxID=455651 RepID=UPI002605A40E|nr:hypothetical protein [uncultured Tateyamaria sp.]
MAEMTQSLTRFLTTLSHAFCNDRLDLLTDHFTYPLPLYTRGELLVFGSSGVLMEALELYRNVARKSRIAQITPRVVATGIPNKGYSQVWTEWDHFDEAGTLKCTSQVRYAVFQDRMALHPKIEMIDYTSIGFPEVCASLPLMQTA